MLNVVTILIIPPSRMNAIIAFIVLYLCLYFSLFLLVTFLGLLITKVIHLVA